MVPVPLSDPSVRYTAGEAEGLAVGDVLGGERDREDWTS